MKQFRQLLEETKFIGPSSQWRKVQELLDEDPRCGSGHCVCTLVIWFYLIVRTKDFLILK